MSEPIFHHCTELAVLLNLPNNGRLFGHNDHSEPSYRKSFELWEQTFGFYPLFLAVGRGDATINMTGYLEQFTRVRASGWDTIKNKRKLTLSEKGKGLNRVLLSFQHVPGVAHKFATWEEVFAWSIYSGKCPPKYIQRLIKQSSRPMTSWIKSACRKDGYVQLCTSAVDPALAARIWVRNKETQQLLLKKGYENIHIRRFPAPTWWK